ASAFLRHASSAAGGSLWSGKVAALRRIAVRLSNAIVRRSGQKDGAGEIHVAGMDLVESDKHNSSTMALTFLLIGSRRRLRRCSSRPPTTHRGRSQLFEPLGCSPVFVTGPPNV